MSFIFTTFDTPPQDTAITQQYWAVDNQLQTAAPALKKVGAAIVIGLALSTVTTMDVPNFIRSQGAQRSSSNRTDLFGIGRFVNNNPVATYSEQLDTPPLPESVLASLIASGINISRATAIIAVAQSSLLSMGHPVLRVEAINLYDPEEETIHVMINLIISASFEQTMELDSKLARIIVKNFTDIPSTFSISVKETT